MAFCVDSSSCLGWALSLFSWTLGLVSANARMKSGTAQKLILNTLSTGVMILMGRVHSNLMIDMPATNEKLRSRAYNWCPFTSANAVDFLFEALREAGLDARIFGPCLVAAIGSATAANAAVCRTLRRVSLASDS